jgi:hypothetical protein
MLFLVMVPVVNATETKLYVDPEAMIVVKNQTFTVNVTVSEVNDLCGYTFNVTWNSDILQYTDDEIDLWEELSNGTECFAMTEQTEDSYWIAMVILWDIPSFNGSADLVTLTFKALEVGNSSLTLNDTYLSDSWGNPINHMITNGIVYVSSDQSVGGISVPIDKFELVTPYIALVVMVVVFIVVPTAFIKYKKKH